MTAPLARYRALVTKGAIEADPAQASAVERLDALARALAARPAASGGSLLSRLFGKAAPEAPRGVYLWGEVGRGKTMLMDLFFETAPVTAKRRAHFHEFMDEVHERIHAARKEIKAGNGADPIAPVARAIAEEARLLCFDEFHVTDIADAMILGRLFTRLFEHGVTVVATSNVPPEGLYREGLNRALFLPFIALLESRVDTVRLDARTDYRLEKLAGAPVYHAPLGPDADRAMDAAWARLTGGEAGAPVTLKLKGREIVVPRAAAGVARFSADDLFRQPLGAADFLRIAHAFHTVMIDHVGVIGANQRNEVRRFIVLVDALYDNGVKLVVSAAAEPDGLYPAGNFAFEFQRTASRLIEMRSTAYLAQAHGAREDGGADKKTPGQDVPGVHRSEV